MAAGSISLLSRQAPSLPEVLHRRQQVVFESASRLNSGLPAPLSRFRAAGPLSHRCAQNPTCRASLQTDQDGKPQQTASQRGGNPTVLHDSPNDALSGKEGNAENGHATSSRSTEQERDQGVSGVVEDVGKGKGLVSDGAALGGSLVAAAVVLGTVVAVGSAGYVFRDQISHSIEYFEGIIEGMGPSGYVFFVLGYAGLEMLAIPAIPLTMSAGLLFGVLNGTILVSIAGTIAATGAFLIARYAARERIMALARSNKKFLAIDRAIGKDSFRVVLFLRLSPLLPFSLGNYLYGITSVELLPYVLASWLGMLPGMWAYVSAGSLGRSFLEAEEGQVLHGGNGSLISLALGLVATLGAAAYMTNIAKGAMEDVEED